MAAIFAAILNIISHKACLPPEGVILYMDALMFASRSAARET